MPQKKSAIVTVDAKSRVTLGAWAGEGVRRFRIGKIATTIILEPLVEIPISALVDAQKKWLKSSETPKDFAKRMCELYKKNSPRKLFGKFADVAIPETWESIPEHERWLYEKKNTVQSIVKELARTASK